MHTSIRSHHVAMTLALIGAVACGGTTAGKTGAPLTGSGGGASESNDSGVAANGDGANRGGASGATDGGGVGDPAQACDQYFETVLLPCEDDASGNASVLLPASEIARLRSRYATVCAARMALPGTGFTPDAIDACVAAVEARGCSADGNAEGPGGVPNASLDCTFPRGTLTDGSACVANEQCLNGDCAAQGVGCGTCVTRATSGPPLPGTPPAGNAVPHAEGEACNPLSLSVWLECAGGLYCQESSGCGTGPSCTGTCKALDVVGAGATCDQQTDLGGAGQPAPRACKAPLICAATVASGSAPDAAASSPVFTCSDGGQAGAQCVTNVDCAPGLGCGNRSPTQQYGACATLTYIEPGEVCTATAACRVGQCLAIGERCPTVLADGAACTVSLLPGATTCDTFADCIGRKCSLAPQTCP